MEQVHQQRFTEQESQHDACGIGAVVNISGQRTHRAVDDALKIVEKLEHRTGKDADGTTGDGVGIMTQLPYAFFEKTARQAGKPLPEAGDYGVAMIFFPQDPLKRMRSRKLLEMILSREGLGLLFWRDVPVCPEILSEKARSSMPAIAQCFIRRPEKTARGLDFDRKLYLARREYEHSVSGTYVVSMSSRTIVYKGLFLVWQLRKFYPDLQDTDFASALALVHSRFSTNTTPSWKRAHPNRIILHNGEINTIRGNINRMLAREETMASPVLGEEIARVYPVVETDGSDSSMLDNTLEFLMYSGIELPKAVMLCIPEPWGRDKNMSREKRDMFHYYASMMEPWDGPAAILFSDGEQVGAVLDRNGLRPARYLVTNDGYLILASEVGALPIPPERIVRKSRLQPGKMLLVDTRTGTVLEDRELKHRYAAEHPYGEWLDQELLQLAEQLGRSREAKSVPKKDAPMETFRSLVREPATVPEQVDGLQQSDDILRLLPPELATLGITELEFEFYRKLVEKQLLTYRLHGDAWREKITERPVTRQDFDEQPRGPFIVCVDTSGSMGGFNEQCAKAFCLALMRIALADNRRCFIMLFSSEVVHYELTSESGLEQAIRFLSQRFRGGTDLASCFRAIIERLQNPQWVDADAVVISDFIAQRLPDEVIAQVGELQRKHQHRFHAVAMSVHGKPGIMRIFDHIWRFDTGLRSRLLRRWRR
mgnify:CR=1 FL=1